MKTYKQFNEAAGKTYINPKKYGVSLNSEDADEALGDLVDELNTLIKDMEKMIKNRELLYVIAHAEMPNVLAALKNIARG